MIKISVKVILPYLRYTAAAGVICKGIHTLFPRKKLQDGPQLNLLLLGKTGNGKSSLGNTILGENIFSVSDKTSSETKVFKSHKNTVNGREIFVVDTPGFRHVENIVKEESIENGLDYLAEAIVRSKEGYDAFLVVLKHPERMSKDEEETFALLGKYFGPEFKEYCMVVVTCGDEYKRKHKGKPFQNFIDEDPLLGATINRFSGKWAFFDNEANGLNEQFEQRKQLVEAVDEILKKNKNQRYTNNEFKEAKRILDQEIEKEEEIKNRKLREEEIEQLRIMHTQKIKELIISELLAIFTGVVKRAMQTGQCFPASSKVIKYPGKIVEIQHIKVGDNILSVGENGKVSFTEVYMNAHENPEAIYPIFQIQTENHLLEVSTGHYLQVNEEGCYKLARDVYVGDAVFTSNMKNPKILVKEKVISIRNGFGKGIYNPMTMNGLLLVDGVLATCYDEQFYPSYSHFFMGAIRFLYRVCPRVLAKLNESRVNGIPKWSWQILHIWK